MNESRVASVVRRFVCAVGAKEGDAKVLIRGAGVAFGLQVAGAGLLFVMQVLLGHWLGPSGYGDYNFTISWAALVAVAVGLGLPTTMVRFLPDYLAHEEWAKMRGLLRASFAATLAAGMTVAVCVSVGALAVWLTGGSANAGILLGIWLAPGLAQIELQSSAIRAYRHIGLAYGPNQVLRPALIMIVCGLYIAFGKPLTSSIALFTTVVVIYGVLLIQAALFRRRLPFQVHDTPPIYEIRIWSRVAVPLLFVASFVIILSQTDIVMVGAMRGAEEAGLYSAASKVASLVGLVLLAASAISAPMFSGLFAQGFHERVQRLATQVAHGVFWPSLVISLGLAGLAVPVLSLFGSEFVAARWDLMVLLLGELVNAAAGAVGYLMIVTGHQREAARVYGWVAVVHVAFNLVGIALLGAIGAAIATTLSLIMWNVWLSVLVVRRLGIHPSIFSKDSRTAQTAS